MWLVRRNRDDCNKHTCQAFSKFFLESVEYLIVNLCPTLVIVVGKCRADLARSGTIGMLNAQRAEADCASECIQLFGEISYQVCTWRFGGVEARRCRGSEV